MQKVIDRDKEINPQMLSSTHTLPNLVLPPVCQPRLPQQEENVALLRHCLNIALSIRSSPIVMLPAVSGPWEMRGLILAWTLLSELGTGRLFLETTSQSAEQEPCARPGEQFLPRYQQVLKWLRCRSCRQDLGHVSVNKMRACLGDFEECLLHSPG